MAGHAPAPFTTMQETNAMTTQHKPSVPHNRNRRLLRAAFALVGVLAAWLVIETLMRVGFDALPAGVQGDIQAVRRVPWREDRIVPPFPYLQDDQFQARIAPGLVDYPIRWSDARFAFTTIPLWEGHIVGLRTDPPRWPLDIIAYGDSFTFCWTAYQDCWVHQLQDKGWHVVNAGMPGTGPGGQLRMMRESAPAVKPGLIIWQWYVNDVSDDYDLARLQNAVESLGESPLPDGPPPLNGLAQYSAIAALVDRRFNQPAKTTPYRHYEMVGIDGRGVLVATNEYPHRHSLKWPSTRFGMAKNLENHAEGQKLAAQVGAKMLIVLIPAKEEAFGDLLAARLGADYLDDLAAARLRLVAQCEAQGWHCIDALPALKAAADARQTVYYAFDSHLDATGNQIVANLVYDYIIDNDLIPTRAPGG
jgi:hypothetical protein